jgi:hypothetical protein
VEQDTKASSRLSLLIARSLQTHFERDRYSQFSVTSNGLLEVSRAIQIY